MANNNNISLYKKIKKNNGVPNALKRLNRLYYIVMDIHQIKEISMIKFDIA